MGFVDGDLGDSSGLEFEVIKLFILLITELVELSSLKLLNFATSPLFLPNRFIKLILLDVPFN